MTSIKNYQITSLPPDTVISCRLVTLLCNDLRYMYIIVSSLPAKGKQKMDPKNQRMVRKGGGGME